MCSVADGQDNADLIGIAKCGTLGKWPQNIERDMVRLMRRKFAIKVEPLELYIEGAGKIAILLPHEMWSFMWMHNPEAARIRFI